MSGQMKFKSGSGLTSLLKEGYKHFGGLEDAILKNIEAVKGLAAITRTSLGPNGMNKLVVNHLENLYITSDAATIVEQLEVVHPAAKMLARAALMQVQEVGDGSNFVVTFGGELLAQAEELLRIGVHPSEIVEGYKKAAAHAFEILESLSVRNLKDARDPAEMQELLTPVLASKQYGNEVALAKLVSEAIVSVIPPAPKTPSVTVDNVRVAKMIGGTFADSQIVRGVVVLRGVEGTVKTVKNAKVAVFASGIEAAATETKSTVVIKSAEELKAYNKGEERMMEENIKAIADSGCNVVISGGAISEIAMHFLEKYKILVVRIASKFELRRLCKAVNATALVRVGAPLPGELGSCDLVTVQELSSRVVTVFQQNNDDSSIATIVLRGATMNLLDDMERAVDDAVNVAKVLCKDGRVVPGGGAAEIEVAHRLSLLADKVTGLEQYAIRKFAEALEVVPRTLAENSGQPEREIITALYAAHAEGKSNVGVSIDGNGVADLVNIDAKDNADAVNKVPVVDSLAVKLSALRLACETAITLLRVDQIIMSKQAGGPKPRQPGAPDDD